MPRRHPPEALSPRALARLRASPRSYVPTDLDLAAARPGQGGGGAGARAEEGASVEWTDEQVGRAGAHVRRRLPGEEVGAGAVVSRPADRPADDPTGGRHGRVPHPRAWVRLPAAFVGARWQPARAALVGVVVVVALAVAVFGLRVAWVRSADGGTVIAPGGGSRAGPPGVTAGAVPVGVSGPAGVASVGATPAASPGAASATVLGASPAGVVVVHVGGRVRHPGVRQLPVGSRVADAVEAVGGATGKADLSALN